MVVLLSRRVLGNRQGFSPGRPGRVSGPGRHIRNRPSGRTVPMALYQKLVRHVFLPLSLWRSGETAQLRHLKEFERTQFLPEEEIRALQWVRLRALLDHAYERCPFYRRRFERAGVVPSDL